MAPESFTTASFVTLCATLMPLSPFLLRNGYQDENHFSKKVKNCTAIAGPPFYVLIQSIPHFLSTTCRVPYFTRPSVL